MKKNFCRRHFPSISAREHRLIANSGNKEVPPSYEPSCDSTKDPPSVGEVAAAPTEKPVPPPPEPKLDHMRFDMRRDEPTHIYNDKNEVIQNRSDEIREMNSDEFKEHLHTMFTRHMSDQMKQERSRQIRLARGRRRAEARDLFPNRKERRAYEAGLLSNPDEIKAEADAELSMIETTPEDLFGEDQFENMLSEITNDIWSSAEFQRGTVDYLRAYDKAWAMYIAMGDQAKKGDPYLEEHPVFRSGAFTHKRAPGSYQNGDLSRASSNFIGYRPVSTYGQAKIRERAGAAQNPEKDFLKKEEAVVRGGYESTWRNVFRRRNPLGSKVEEDAFVQKLVDQNLRKQGFRQEQIDRSKLPDPDHLRVPPEADRKDPSEYLGAFENIDLRDRGLVLKRIVSTLGISDIRRISDLQEKGVHIAELKFLKMDIGIPQILHFSSRPEVRRGEEETPSKAGLALIDRSEKNADIRPEITMIDFSDVDTMLNDRNPWRNGFLQSTDLNDTHRGVRSELKNIAPFDRDAYNPAVYQSLIPQCREKNISKFALDELPKLCEVSSKALIIAKDLEHIFKEIPKMRTTADWTGDQQNAVKRMAKETSNPGILEAILKQHCLTEKGGDKSKENFKKLWDELRT
ncbi:MAG: hypothetical protein AAB544_04650 [Patescibacteria group bacterium]